MEPTLRSTAPTPGVPDAPTPQGVPGAPTLRSATPILTQAGGIAPGPHRIHPAYVVLTALRTALIVIVASLAGFSSTLPAILSEIRVSPLLITGIALAFLVVLLAIISLVSFIYYKRFLWEITQSDIHVYSGIIFKKQVHIPFRKVQSIDFQAGILERVLGLVRLKIETAGGASNTGVLIPSLKLGEAEALRAEVFRRKRANTATGAAAASVAASGMPVATAASAAASAALPPTLSSTALPPTLGGAQNPTSPPPLGTSADGFVRDLAQVSDEFRGVFAESYEEDAPIEYEHSLSARELFLASVSGDHNFVVLAFIVGFLSQIPLFLNLFGFNVSTEQLIISASARLAIPYLIAGVFVFAGFLFVATIAATAISYGGFKCRRRGGRIEVERGLLSRQYKGVAVARVQSVEIRQGFIRRMAGYAELRLKTVDSLSDSSQQSNGSAQMQAMGLVVHPFVKMDKVASILVSLVPEYAECPTIAEAHTLPPVAQRRAFMRLTILPMLVVALVLLAADFFALIPYAPEHIARPILLGSWILYGLILVLCIVASILWYRHASYAYNRTMLYLRQGSWSIVTSLIPRRKIQWAGNRQNPFQRLAQVASITATTAAGVGGTTTTLRDLPLKDADAFIDWLRPREK